jgi:hypothetical protein
MRCFPVCELWPLTEEVLDSTTSVDAWVDELRRLSAVAVGTARENYKLMAAEKQNLWGPAKCEYASVQLFSVDDVGS